jgi:tetratricopeptide (TPR) repeat protein/DNA-binding CsgD family transcriptional regulator
MKHFLFFIAPLFCLLLVSCNTKISSEADDIDSETSKAFVENWFKAEMSAGLHYNAPEYCFKKIKQTMPVKAWRYSIENLYYNLPTTIKGDSIEKWIDLADSVMQEENVHAFILMIRGQNELEKGAYDQAIEYLQESYTLDVKYNQKFRASDAQRYLARCFLLKGNYPAALSMLTKVYAFLETHNNVYHQVRIFETLIDISRVGLVSNDPEKALEFARKALIYCTNNENTYGQIVTSSEFVANAFLKLNQPDSALIILESVEKIRTLYQISYDSSNTHFLLGKTLCLLGKYPEALEHLQVAESSNINHLSRFRSSELWAAKGDYFLHTANPDSAVSCYEIAARTTPDTSFMSTLHFKLSDIFKEKGTPSQALFHFEKGYFFSKAFFSAQKDRTIGKLESSIALLTEENRVKLLLEKQKNHRIQFGLLVLIFILIGGVAGLQLNRMRRREILLKKEKELANALQLIQKQELIITSKKLTQKEVELKKSKHTLHLKDVLIKNLELKIKSPNKNSSKTPEKQLRVLTDKDWAEFKTKFEIQYPDYVSRLKAQFPSITNAEIRQFIFIKIHLESAEISAICGISTNTVNQTRTRLRAKLGLQNHENLKLFVHDF